MKEVPQWIAISDLNFFDGNVDEFVRCLEGVSDLGLQAVMIRDKDRPADSVEALIKEVTRFRRLRDFQVLLNLGHEDQVEERIRWLNRYELDGVHLPDRRWNFESLRVQIGENKLVGKSVHDTTTLAQYEGKLDYSIVGPIFLPKDKPESKTLGFSGLRDAVREFSPILALGGISEENLLEMIHRGAYGVAFRLRKDRTLFYQAMSRAFDKEMHRDRA